MKGNNERSTVSQKHFVCISTYLNVIFETLQNWSLSVEFFCDENGRELERENW